MFTKQFQEALIAEETAQAKYYQAIHDLKNSSKPFIQPKLTSSRSSLDNVSIKSAPTLTRSASDIHPTPPMLRQKRRPKNYKLSNSASTNSIHHTLPRPKSYVPFQGCVETPPPPPGRGMHEILHALSYAPTHESFSADCQQQQQLTIPPPPQLKIPPREPKIVHVKKSRSFASLMCHNAQTEAIDPVLYVPENEPVYAPTNPLNHPENSPVFNVHPPVIYPPPDLVPSSTFKPKNSSASSPIRRSNSSLGSSSATSSAETSSSSMSSIIQNHHVLESIRETSPMIASSRF